MGANKEGHGLNGSRLQNWIEHEVLHLKMNREKDVLEADIPDRSLSLRVPIAAHVMLSRIAQNLSRSKTACGEEIICNAIRDAYEQFDLPPLQRKDLEDYVAQTEKTAGEKSG